MARVSERGERSPANIISVDIGTTTIACHHFDRSGISLYQTTRKVRAHSKFDSTFQSEHKLNLCLSSVILSRKQSLRTVSEVNGYK